MKIEFDEVKRRKTLQDRGLDFADAYFVFQGIHINFQDTRQDYGETRYVTMGMLAGMVVVIAWTPRGSASQPVRRIISMRRANEREIEAFRQQL